MTGPDRPKIYKKRVLLMVTFFVHSASIWRRKIQHLGYWLKGLCASNAPDTLVRKLPRAQIAACHSNLEKLGQVW